MTLSGVDTKRPSRKIVIPRRAEPVERAASVEPVAPVAPIAPVARPTRPVVPVRPATSTFKPVRSVAVRPVRPAVMQPAVRPAAVRPVVTRPAAVKPAVRPVVTRPAAVKPAVRPAAVKPAVRPAARPVARPAVQEVTQMSMPMHMLLRDMWAGAHNVAQDSKASITQGALQVYNAPRCAIAEHLCRELIGNMLDQARRCGTTRNIHFGYDPQTGCVTAMNDGNGFDLAEDFVTHDGQRCSKVQACATVTGVGGSFADGDDGIGTNGMGLKIAIANSTWAQIETIDARPGKPILTYRQVFRGVNCTTTQYNIEEPVRDAPCSDFPEVIRRGGTRIVLQFNWAHLGVRQMHSDAPYDIPGTTLDYSAAVNATPDLREGFKQAIEELVTIAALYSDFLSYKCRMTYDVGNGPVVVNTDLLRVMRNTHGGLVAQTSGEMPWTVFLGVSESNGAERIGIVNGVRMDKGSIMDKIVNIVADDVVARCGKIFTCKPLDVKKRLRVGVISCVANLSNDSQTKNRVSEPKTRWKNYELSQATLDKFWAEMGGTLVEMLQPTKRMNREVKLNFTHAQHATSRRNRKQPVTLFIAEGDSALGVYYKALSLPSVPEINNEYCAGYTIRGVPLNVWDDAVYLNGGNTIMPGKRTEANERLSILRQIIGLQYGKRYDNTSAIAELKYDRVVLLVDQDTDGCGKIIMLIWMYFWTFWPELLDTNPHYVQWLKTPIMRVYARGARRTKAGPPEPIKEFYDLTEAEAWREANADKQVDTFYYKGLGAHEEELGEVSRMMRNYETRLVSITADQLAEFSMVDFYGVSTAARKIILQSSRVERVEIIRRIREAEAEAGDSSGDVTTRAVVSRNGDRHRPLQAIATKVDSFESNLPITALLYGERLDFMLDSLNRTLPGIDGLVESRRKLVCTIQNCKDRRKVFEWGSAVAGTTKYSHGDAAINGVITNVLKRGTDTGNQLCVMVPRGSIGTLNQGYNNAASPRYLSAIPAASLLSSLFPTADNAVLDYHFEGNTRIEPKSYYPTLCYVLYNVCEGLACGFTTAIYPRTAQSIMERLVWYLDNRISTAAEAAAATAAGDRLDWLHTVDAEDTPAAPDVSAVPDVPVLRHTALRPKRVFSRRPIVMPAGRTAVSAAATSDTTASDAVAAVAAKTSPTKPPGLVPFEFRTGARIVRHAGKIYIGARYTQKTHSATMTEICITQLHSHYTAQSFVDRFNDDKYSDVVHSCTDYTTNSMRIVLIVKNAGLAAVVTKQWNAIETYFKLWKRYNPILNIQEDRVVQYPDYEELFDAWYMKRYECYQRRFERSRVAIELEIELIEQRQRYTQLYAKLNAGRTKTVAQMTSAIQQAGGFYPMETKYCNAHSSIGIATCDLRAAALGPEASFDFLLHMTITALSQESYARRAEQLAALHAELERLKDPQLVFSVWHEEASAAHHAIVQAAELALECEKQ